MMKPFLGLWTSASRTVKLMSHKQIKETGGKGNGYTKATGFAQ